MADPGGDRGEESKRLALTLRTIPSVELKTDFKPIRIVAITKQFVLLQSKRTIRIIIVREVFVLPVRFWSGQSEIVHPEVATITVRVLAPRH